ncbi:MAG TPA: heme-binding protein, partial [Bryobacteraceae bacterium]|nr:heme-binding protein [Bryobacteraceae bacterium]
MNYLRDNRALSIGITLTAMVFSALLFTGRARAFDDPPVSDPNAGITGPVLTASDVQTVVQAAASAIGLPYTVAVTDRQGDVLAVYQKANAPALAQANFGIMADAKDVAIALARTASFFSNSQAPLSSRTVRYISGDHFPPGIMFTGSAALYGIENTNRGCSFNTNYIPGQEIPPSTRLDGTPGLGILTGKADLMDSDPFAVNPGGVPLFKGGVLVGGVGVAGIPPDAAEFAAANGFLAFPLSPVPDPGVVFIDGIALPFVNNLSRPAGFTAGAADGSYFLGPLDAPKSAPEGDLVAPRDGPVGGLTAAEVRAIVDRTIAQG